jgi:pimeloyl-ACP methyl ester carboxylesterase
VRLFRVLLVAALVVAVAALAGAGPWAAAQARAVVVMGTTMELPVVASAARALTREPRVDEIRLAGAPATLYRPARGAGPWPAVLFVNGATRRGREEPAVRRLAEGLARTGHLVAVPDFPGLLGLTLTEDDLEATVAAAAALAARPGAEEGRVALVAVSLGGTLALLAAQDEALAGSVPVVAAVAPFTDLRETIRLATTSHHRVGDRLVPHATDAFVREVVEDSLAAIADTAAAPAVQAALRNDDPARFDELYAAAPPELREPVERLSPVRRAGRLTMRVELVSAPDDRYFPPEQTRLLAEQAPDARLTLSRVLDHADLRIPWRDPTDVLRFNRFVVRTLVEARG